MSRSKDDGRLGVRNLLRRFRSPSSSPGPRGVSRSPSASPAAPPSGSPGTASGLPKGSAQDSAAQHAPPDAASTALVGKPDDLDDFRNALWKSAYDKLQADEPDMMKAYELLAKDVALQADNAVPSSATTPAQQSGISDEKALTQGDIRLIAEREESNMKNKQWTYPWFGQAKKVRDTAETILKGVTSASSLISAGMTMAPAYVSLPWSMISVLIPFMLQSLQTVNEAISGLNEVTSILLTYAYAEQEFLPPIVTRDAFSKAVFGLYVSVFRYQASVALYFAKSTLSRVGYNMSPKHASWKDALQAVKDEELKCHIPIQALSTRLGQHGTKEVKDLLRRGAQLMTDAMQQALSESRLREQIATWVSPIDVRDSHLEVRQRLGDSYFGTGRWLLDDDENFEDWKRSDGGVLLLHGAVGVGKSSLTSIVIENLLQNSREQVAFFYCSSSSKSESRRDARNEPLNILRSLLAQCIVMPDGSIADSVKDLFDTKSSVGGCDLPLQATVAQLKDVLDLRPGEPVTIVIDALDECSDPAELLNSLSSIHLSKANVRYFISSRFGTHPDDFDPATPFPRCMTLSIKAQNSADINTYVEKEVRARHYKTGMTTGQADRLIASLKKYAEGIFRWVVLEIDIFLPRSSRQGRRQQVADIERRLVLLESSNAPAVERLFESYEEIYQYALGREDEFERRKLVKTMIKWVLGVFRTFTIWEFIVAISCKIRLERAKALALRAMSGDCGHDFNEDGAAGTPSEIPYRPNIIDDSDFWPSHAEVSLTAAVFEDETEDLKITPDKFERIVEDLMDYCSNFFQIDHRGLIRLAHLSVRQFFEQHRNAEFGRPNQHLEVALSLLQFRTWFLTPRIRLSGAAWDALKSEVNSAKHMSEWVLFNSYLPDYWSLHCRAAKSSDELSAILSLDQLDRDLYTPVHLQLARKLDLVSSDRLGKTRLLRAISLESEVAIDVLLRAATTTDSDNIHRFTQCRDTAGNSALHLAVLHGNSRTFRNLINAKADPQAQDRYGMTPLQLAELFGRKDILDHAARMRLHLTSHGHDNADSNDESTSQGPQQGLCDRPKIRIHNDCRSCNLEEWVEGSRKGERFQWPYRDLVAGHDARCPFCEYLFLSVHRPVTLDDDTPIEDEVLEVWVELGADNVTSDDKRDLLLLSFPDSLPVVEFELCLDPRDIDSSASQLLTGRLVRSDRTSDSAVALISQWINNCRKEHPQCGVPTTTTQQAVPELLIDVGQDLSDVRLEESGNIAPGAQKFVFLSYNLGRYLPTLNAGTANYNQLRKGVSVDELPILYRDAFRLCHALGYRYIWIDALCILHDDTDALQRALSHMGLYIANAELVVAATGPGVNQSLINTDEWGYPWKHKTFKASVDDPHPNEFELIVRNKLPTVSEEIQMIAAHRAWRTQEALLASKLVVFGEAQIVWSCAGAQQSESSSISMPPPQNSFHDLQAWVQRNTGHLADSEVRGVVIRRWYSVASTVSQGRLSVEHDRLSSMAGLAVAFVRLLNSGDSGILAGIPIEDLPHGLLWFDDRDMGFARGERLDPSWSWAMEQRVAPSWSWASNEGAVSYAFVPGLKVSYSIPEALKFSYLGASRGSDQGFGENASLNFSAVTMDGSCLEVVSEFEYFWDRCHFTKLHEFDWAATLSRCRLALCAPWTFRKGPGKDTARWLGLVLEPIEEGVYVRVGMFMGLSTDSPLEGWERTTIELC